MKRHVRTVAFLGLVAAAAAVAASGCNNARTAPTTRILVGDFLSPAQTQEQITLTIGNRTGTFHLNRGVHGDNVQWIEFELPAGVHYYDAVGTTQQYDPYGNLVTLQGRGSGTVTVAAGKRYTIFQNFGPNGYTIALKEVP